MDLPVRSGGAHERRELLSVLARNGRWMPGDIPRRTIEELPRPSPAHRARRCPQPSLREDRQSGECQPPDASTLLPGARPGGEVVRGVQAKVVQQDIRERRSNARGAHPDAYALLGRSRAPQTAHRLLLVGRGGGNIVTSITRNGISLFESQARRLTRGMGRTVAHIIISSAGRYEVEKVGEFGEV